MSEKDYNYVPDLWFYKFGYRPKQPPCSPARLNLGDSFSTDNGILTWTLTNVILNQTTIKQSDASHLNYTGTPLDVCDVIYLSVVADVRTSTGTLTAEVECNTTEVTFVMTTSTTVGRTFSGMVGNSIIANNNVSWEAYQL